MPGAIEDLKNETGPTLWGSLGFFKMGLKFGFEFNNSMVELLKQCHCFEIRQDSFMGGFLETTVTIPNHGIDVLFKLRVD